MCTSLVSERLGQTRQPWEALTLSCSWVSSVMVCVAQHCCAMQTDAATMLVVLASSRRLLLRLEKCGKRIIEMLVARFEGESVLKRWCSCCYVYL